MPALLQASLLVALGSAVGGVARYLLTVAVAACCASAFPWATLAINVCGSAAIGACMPLLGKDTPGNQFVVIGVLGGFTTFSAFSWQVLDLVHQQRTGAAAAYVAASLVLCLAGVAAGWWLVQAAR